MNPPIYKGYPLSLLTRLSLPEAPIQLWMWAPTQDGRWYEDIETTSLLTGMGYQRMEWDEGHHLSAALLSQLCDVHYVDSLHPTQSKQHWLWARPLDIEHVQHTPVILAFRLAPDSAPKTTDNALPFLHFLPPPQIGELALIKEDGKDYVYTRDRIGEAGMVIWQEMGNAIRALAGSTAWSAFSPLLHVCSDLASYHLMVGELASKISRTQGKEQQEAKATLQTIEQARREVVALEESFQAPDWTARWEEIQRMAKRLATAYFAYHQSQAAPAPVESGQHRPLPIVATIFADGQALISSCLPFQAVVSSIHNAASGATKWEHPKDQAPYFLSEKDSGNTIIEYKAGHKDEVFNDQTTASLWKQVQQFTDLDNDVLLAMIAHLIKCAEEDGSTWFFASNFLDYRGVQPRMQADTPGGAKRRAGHRQEDISDVGKSVDRIGNIWITINQFIEEEAASATSKRKRRKRKEYTHRGRLLSIEEAWTQRELETNDPGMEIGWKIRAGSWLKTFLQSPNRQVASLCQKTLEYDPYREQWEKRLSRYFMFHIRMNARGSSVAFNREIGKLLKELNLPIDERFPQRTRDRFEKALNRLVEDRQIDAWQYKAEVQLPARNWLGTWLEQSITVYVAPTKHLPAEQEDEERA